MKPFLLTFLFLASNPLQAPAETIQSPRCLFAASLQEAAIKDRTEHKLNLGNVSVEAKGKDSRILLIRDDSDSAKFWYDQLEGNPQARKDLILMGFTAVILANKKHGTFIFDLTHEGAADTDVLNA